MAKKILVVDDEEDIRKSVSQVLEINGYEVKTANDGDECLKQAQEFKPDLILLDIMMPGLSIDEVLNQLKNIKIAFMSVVRISDARKRGLCSHENIMDFFQKPFNVTDLIDRVEIIVND